jgi:N-acetylmuramoyl-L-alanine amidase
VRTSQNVNISNSARAAAANREHADLFIRLHCDGNNNHSMSGLSTLVPKSNKWTAPIVASSAKAASYVHRAVIAATGATDRGIVPRSDMSGFNWSKVPTVLVEMGFLSNPAEDVKLGSPGYQAKLATGLANGISNYLKSR